MATGVLWILELSTDRGGRREERRGKRREGGEEEREEGKEKRRDEERQERGRGEEGGRMSQHTTINCKIPRSTVSYHIA